MCLEFSRLLWYLLSEVAGTEGSHLNNNALRYWCIFCVLQNTGSCSGKAYGSARKAALKSVESR